MEEILKDIEGYEGLYQVSNLGRVKSSRRKGSEIDKILKGSIDRDGYVIVTLCNCGVEKKTRVHRLVAMAFILNLNIKPQVNHIDGIKTNNCINNLEWVTSYENMKHARDKGLVLHNSLRKRKETLSLIDTSTGIIYSSIKEASKIYLISRSHLSHMLNGTRTNKTNLQFYNPTKQ